MSQLRIGLVSAQGAPGVTITALALATSAGSDGLFVELDPAGGSVECWTGRAGEAGLLGLVSELRRPVTPESLAPHAVETPPGVWSILAPTAGPMAETAMAAADGQLLAALGEAAAELVVVDAGRWSRSQVTARRLVGANVVGIVCRPTVSGIEHARWLVEPLRDVVDAPIALVVVGERGYGPAEVGAAVGIPVVGVMAWDPRGVDALVSSGAGRGWSRRPLARAAHATRAGFDRAVSGVGVHGG